MTEVPSNRTQQLDPAVLEALRYHHRLYESLHLDRLRGTKEGHWINEAFVVRLYAILEAHRVVGNNKAIDRSLAGWEHVELCRRLRHEIAHAHGEVDDNEAHRLYDAMRRVFGLGDQESVLPGKFILSKDKVLRPWVTTCIAYCEALIAREKEL